jgi:N,N'-diacetyllegionaminate synthase
MKIGKIDLDKEILIIAEIGNNHEGDIELAKKMIGLAAKAGVQAVKFQTVVPEKLVSSDQTARIEKLKKFQFSYDQFRELKRVCDDEGIMFLSTPFDIDSVVFLDELVPAFKIASGDNTFYPLLKAVAETCKPILLSTGITTIEDIRKSVLVIEETWKAKGISTGEFALLHCNVSYPTPPEDVNLVAIDALKEFGCTVGYSDHTLGTDAAIMSVAYGARVIEKHFTYDKTIASFRDHQLSADSVEMKYIVEKVKLAQVMHGSTGKQVTQSESENVGTVRRSIAAGRDIREGDVITMDMLMWVRPGTGIAVGNEDKVLNYKAKRAISFGELLTNDILTK